MKKWKWYHYLGLLGLACLILAGALSLWVSQYTSITIVYGNDKECAVTETQTSVYQILSPSDAVADTCNTADYQEATTTLDDGSILAYFIEYDGQFASWMVPNDFSCGSNWSDTGVEISGTAHVPDLDVAIVACSNGDTEIIMEAYTTP